MVKITIDFETRSRVNLKKAGAYEYSVDPSTKVLCLAFKSNQSKTCHLFTFDQMQRRWKDFPENFRATWLEWIESNGVVFSAHNAFFEQCIYLNVLVKRFGWPEIPIEKWRCTAAKAAACAIPRNLADAGAVMRTSRQKDYEGHRIMMKLCKPTAAFTKWFKAGDDIRKGKRVGHKTRELAAAEPPSMFHEPDTTPEDFRKLYAYCKMDIYSEEDLDNALPDLPGFEQRIWEIDQRINLRGIAVDMPLVNRISEIMAKESRTMNKELDILTMGLVSSGNARNAILDFLTLEGIELPDLRAKTVDDFLASGKVTGDAEKILKIRRALSKASTAKYGMFLLRAKSDGRVRDLLLYHAASTGRWGGRGIQPQNFPRGIIKDIYEAIDRIKTCSVDELKLLYGENLMPLFSSVLRGMFIASDMHNMFVEDYSAIECRVTWWLAGHESGLQMFRDGLDPYREMAVGIYRKSILEITDDERQVGKAAVLGCGYQMGGKKFVTSAWDVYRAKVDKEMAKVAVSVYRDVHYPVTEMWENYQSACIAAVENPKKRYRVNKVKFYMSGRFLQIELPSGRSLYYADPKVMTEKIFPYTMNEETNYSGVMSVLQEAKAKGATIGKPFFSKKLTFMAVNQKARKEDCVIPKWTREKTYGGKIVENVVQAVSRDILAEAIVRAWDEGFFVLMHSHDECVSEAPKAWEAFDGEKYKEIMEALPCWAEGLPLKSSGWVDVRYKKG